MDQKEYRKKLKQILDSVYTPLEKLNRLTSLNCEYLAGGPLNKLDQDQEKEKK